VVEQRVVALGEVGDMPLMGQQMTLVGWSEFLDRLAPGSSAGHRIHGRAARRSARRSIGTSGAILAGGTRNAWAISLAGAGFESLVDHIL